MHEDRQQNAFAALDILARADSTAFAAGRSDAAERQVTAAEAQTLNATRAGAAWSTGDGENKKWWTRATSVRSDAMPAQTSGYFVFVVRFSVSWSRAAVRNVYVLCVNNENIAKNMAEKEMQHEAAQHYDGKAVFENIRRGREVSLATRERYGNSVYVGSDIWPK